jgi:hypothetical protein
MMHSQYTDILWCTVTILISYDARSLYWYTMMHGHYTDILWCTVTILISYDARSLYWYPMMHGQQDIQCLSHTFFSTREFCSNFPPISISIVREILSLRYRDSFFCCRCMLVLVPYFYLATLKIHYMSHRRILGYATYIHNSWQRWWGHVWKRLEMYTVHI